MADWNRKVVVVTGGSAGLGWHLARAFYQQGATVIIWGRDLERLEEARRRLGPDDQRTWAQRVDVTQDAEVQTGLQELLERWGQIDVWINNVGKSIRTRLDETPLSSFQELMRVNFETVVRCSQAVVPHLQPTRGHLVNIGSLSSKLAWPLMGPYTTSKHAVAGYTQQLQLEGPREIHVLLVCPGPIRRDDAQTRYTEQATGLGDAARRPGAGAPVKGIDPQDLARRVVRACEQRRTQLLVPGYLRWLLAISGLSASWGLALLRRVTPATPPKTPADPPATGQDVSTPSGRSS